MEKIRKTAVAGSFYPSEAKELSDLVDSLIYEKPAEELPPPKAIIAPHAGYIYSGSVAASAYRLWLPLKGEVERVVVLAPAHRVGFAGMALIDADFYETPLGNVEIDKAAYAEIAKLPEVLYLDAAHEEEHSLEVHLPFLLQVLGGFKLVPIVVGDANAEDVSRVLETLWGGEETRIVISSDLSHFHSYSLAQECDEETAKAIMTLNDKAIYEDAACGKRPIGGLLHLARLHGFKVKQLDLRNSGDVTGEKNRVVGYGSWGFWE